MIALTVAILLASLLGSFHCAGMCGAFLAIASGGTETGVRRQTMLQCAYHAGRLITYVALGAAAGASGHLVNLAGALAGLRPVAAILAGATMVFFGIVTLLQARGMRLQRLVLPTAWLAFMQAGHRAAMNRPPVLRAFIIGLLTTLLPCGWLYAFVMTAAGVADPLRGAGVMAVFWLGTLPMLIAVGTGVRAILGPVGAKLPAMTAIVLVVVGLYTLVGRTLLDPVAMAARIDSRHAAPANVSAPETRVENPCHETSATLIVPNPSDPHACCKPNDSRH